MFADYEGKLVRDDYRAAFAKHLLLIWLMFHVRLSACVPASLRLPAHVHLYAIKPPIR